MSQANPVKQRKAQFTNVKNEGGFITVDPINIQRMSDKPDAKEQIV